MCGVIYWLGDNSFARGYFVFSKPLVAGFLVGCVFGDPLQGAICGAEINMIYLGWIGAGGSSPADPCAAGVLSTAFVLASGLDMDAALVLAVPVGLVAIALYTMLMTVMAACAHLAQKYINDGKFNLLWFAAWGLPLILTFIGYAIPCMLCAYFGADLVTQLATVLTGRILTVVSLIGGMLPAIGIAINLSFIFKNEARIWLLVGFIAAAYMGLSLIPIAMIGFVGAVLYFYRTADKEVAE
jgi:PTS system mannose-specific IIC component